MSLVRCHFSHERRFKGYLVTSHDLFCVTISKVNIPLHLTYFRQATLPEIEKVSPKERGNTSLHFNLKSIYVDSVLGFY